MKCPYQVTEVKKSPQTTHRLFADCAQSECPYWGTIRVDVVSNKAIKGCRKAEREVAR